MGWGFVAEHPAFAELCERLGIVFVGPDADVMRALGDKIEAKKLAEQAGVPVAAWSGGAVESAEDAVAVGEKLGYPLMIKAAAGGGGRGMRRVTKPDEMADAFERARAEAKQSFGDESVLIESLVGNARHVEVQLMADGQGGVWALGVRDCSYQRRHQKVVEESASPALTAEQERELAESAVRLARNAGYRGAGTVEFLYEPEGERFSFMEVNARLQVEHPVTEVVTGADLVALQLHVAAGGTLEGDPPPPHGHAIEVRLNAEDPARGFAPAPGRITLLRLPSGPGVRVDTGVAEGDSVPPEFDSMIAKIIAHGATREQAIARLRRAVADTMVVIDEGTTNQGFLLELLGRPELRRGEADTGWLDRLQGADEVQPLRHADTALIQAAIALCDAATADERARFYALARRGRPHAEADICRTVDLLHRGTSYRFGVCQVGPARYLVEVDGARIEADVEWVSEHERRLSYGGRSFRTMTALQDNDLLVEVNGVPHRVSRDEGGLVRSHAPGVVVAIRVSEGDEVAAGDVVAVTESMKMETSLTAPVAGRVREVLVAANVQVPGGRPLVQIDPLDDAPAAVEGDRVTLRRRRPRAGRRPERARAPAPARARLRRHARRGASASSARCSTRRPTSSKEARLFEVYADVRALNRPHAERGSGAEALASPQEHLHAFLRSLDVEGRGPARPLRRPARARARPLRGQRPRPHRGARGRGLPPVPGPAARGHRARRRARAARAPARAGRGAERRTPPTRSAACSTASRPRSPRASPRWPSWRASCAGARSTARPSRPRARRPTPRCARTSPRWPSGPDDGDREAHLQALVDCPQPLARLLTQGTDDFLLEALTRRYYRIRALEGLERRVVDGVAFLLTSYEHEGRRHHVAATFAEPERLPAALAALASYARTLPDGEPLLGDLYGTSAPADVSALVAGAGLPPAVARIAFVAPAGRRSHGVDVATFNRGPDGELAEDRDLRGLHPLMAQRMDLWRLENFALKRLPSSPDVYLFHAQARDNERDERLVAVAEVRDLTPARDDDGNIVGAARPRADRPPGVRGDARRPVAPRPPRPPGVEPPAALRVARRGVRARRGARGHHARSAACRPGSGLEMVAAAGRRPRPALLQPGRPRRGRRGRRPAHAAAAAARRGRPADRLRAPPRHGPPRRDRQDPRAAASPQPGAPIPAGEFAEYDLDDDSGRLVPVDRPARHQHGEHRDRRDHEPHRPLPRGDAARRAARRPDPRPGLAGRGRVPARDRRARPRRASSTCRSSGSRCPPARASRWTRARRTWTGSRPRCAASSTFTQAGGEINVVVTGINVGAQPYWNAEATMLMHTKGILVMTPESAMVLTGKQALDYSGGVSAEDNFGIGGYERVMGPNGQAQYRAPDLAGACELLLAYYEHTYGRRASASRAAPRRATRATATSAPRRTRRRARTSRPSARSSPRRRTPAARSRSTSAP